MNMVTALLAYGPTSFTGNVLWVGVYLLIAIRQYWWIFACSLVATFLIRIFTSRRRRRSARRWNIGRFVYICSWSGLVVAVLEPILGRITSLGF